MTVFTVQIFILPKFKDNTLEGACGRRRTRNTKINTKVASLYDMPLTDLPNLLDNE
jgi:hypothetical protein